MRTVLKRRVVLLALLSSIAISGLAWADDDDDHDRARRAVEEGDVLPLARILDILRGELGGELVDVEFEEKEGRFVYELKVVTPSGRLTEIDVDAANAKVLKREDD